MFELPLLKLDTSTGVDEDNNQRQLPVRGLRWAKYRCQEAQVIHIRERAFSGPYNRIARPVLGLAKHSPALQVFFLELCNEHAFDGSDDNLSGLDSPDLYKNDWRHNLAVRLAACAPRLHAFRCSAWDFNTFPVMPNLKHLMLSVHCYALLSGANSLTALQSLETLQLRAYGFSDVQYWCGAPDFGSEGWFDCPALELSSLSRLHSLALENITAEGTIVSLSCAVHVCLFGHHRVGHPVWSVISIDALRSIEWQDIGCNANIVTIEDIPRAMQEASCLDCVKIHDVGGWRSKELPSALAHVRILTIKSGCIDFHVPLNVRWQCICLSARAVLDVTFEDVGAFARMPIKFCFEIDVDAGIMGGALGHEWLPLDAALVQSKPDWVSKAKQLEHECECEGECDCDEDEIYQLLYEQFPGKFEQLMRCTCGACMVLGAR
ncbi:hypothetical protein COCOBI_18-0530 [Coccomyxa sp. Obi]|nr:hypothetical protein COCOBI_18-0530 [Coccomyxa sp. Obi]